MQSVLFGNVPVRMKVDTGADVTAIPETVYKQALHPSPKLSNPDRILGGPDGKALPVMESFRASMSLPTSNQSSQQTVYLVRGLQTPLLGRPAIQSLSLLKQLDALSMTPPDGSHVQDRFPSIFSGLGEFKGPPHQICLQDNPTPCSL